MSDSYYIELFMNEFIKTTGQLCAMSTGTLIFVPLYMYYNKVGFFSKKKPE